MSYQEDRFIEVANAIRQKDSTTEPIKATDFATRILAIESGGGLPSTNSGLFTGATIPLTYKNNTNTYENTYEYKSSGYNITISGLTGRATITGNGTKSVSVAFDVTSATSSLAEFTISLNDGDNTYTYNGLHAHYGATVTGILTLAYTNIPRTGTGTIGTEYKFIVSDDDNFPSFSSANILWEGIYSYQVLNTLIGNFSLTSIGNYFLRNCYSFNQPLTIPSGVTSIGNGFLYNCYSFNQPLTIPSGVASIGNDFLTGCYSFNQPLTIPSGVTSIGNYFLAVCSSFNQPLDISGVTSIGNYFLADCYSFNQPLTIPSGVTSIVNYFLANCYSFNQPLDISGVTSIGTNFLYNCYSFNQPLTIHSGGTSIGNYFLAGSYSFNQPLDISGVASIGSHFLYNCYSFNKPLTIPSGVTSIGTNFLSYCFSLSTITYNSSTYPTDNYSLSQSGSSKTSLDGSGIVVYGTQRAGLITALPNRTSSPYRKLINGGAN